jgi:predicted Zn-ribbon and HTH transcriptional regulator
MLYVGEIIIKGFQCERCGHKWVPREDESPRVCPKCKSPYWDRPRGERKKQDLDIKEKRRLR